VANTLAYYDTATITAVKSFIVQAPESNKVSIVTSKIDPNFYCFYAAEKCHGNSKPWLAS
jgi:hypothetical protein